MDFFIASFLQEIWLGCLEWVRVCSRNWEALVNKANKPPAFLGCILVMGEGGMENEQHKSTPSMRTAVIAREKNKAEKGNRGLLGG